MKINCEKCQAKYSIADEKVRGKTFRIRCKKCGHVIIVRDKAAAASGGEEAAPAAAPAEAAGWHVAVGGETIGPLSEHAICERIEQGDFRQDASVWRDGFEDWVPMHSVEAFANVLARVGGGASANERGMDGVHMGGSAGEDLGHESPSSSPSSPRVQSLTGQRNENSVLFSLDSLQKVGSGAAASSPQAGAAAATLSPGLSPHAEPLGGPGGSFTPSTAAPTSEGSGLIDIRAMSQVLSQAKTEAPKHDESLLPSFGGSGLGGLAAQPVAVEEPLPMVQDRGVAPESDSSKSNVGLVLFAAMGSVALVLGLGYFFVVQPMMKQMADGAEAANRAADQRAELARAQERANLAQAELEREREAAKQAAAEAAQVAAADDAAAAATPRPTDAGLGGRRDRGVPDRRRRGPSGKPGADATPKVGGAAPAARDNASGSAGRKPAAAPEKKESDGGNIDVDCLLDPGLAKCGKKKAAARKPARKNPGAAKPSVDSSLPAALSQSQLLSGLRSAKSRAKGCGKKHGADAGARVRVRMSISGATGKVASAVPQGEHASTALGKCVAKAASAASFPKFQKRSQGLQYNFKM